MQQHTRRDFLRQGSFVGGALALVAGMPAAGRCRAEQDSADGASSSAGKSTIAKQTSIGSPQADAHLAPLDYGRSFICNTSPANSARFWIESRTLLWEPDRPEPQVFYQCASCKSENTFGRRDLFFADNYDFLPIFGDDMLLIFRRHAYLNADYRQLRTPADSWGEPLLKLRRPRQCDELSLDDWPAIRDATAEAMPLVAQTELRNSDTGHRAVIEYPIKTMNISHPKRMFQVDTGPVALPDLRRSYAPPIDCLRLAFVAFNAADFADFVVEQPTTIPVDAGDGRPGETKVYHYSNPISLPARNRLFVVRA